MAKITDKYKREVKLYILLVSVMKKSYQLAVAHSTLAPTIPVLRQASIISPLSLYQKRPHIPIALQDVIFEKLIMYRITFQISGYKNPFTAS